MCTDACQCVDCGNRPEPLRDDSTSVLDDSLVDDTTEDEGEEDGSEEEVYDSDDEIY